MTVSRSRSAFTLAAIAAIAASVGYLYQVPLRAATVSAATCNFGDVSNAINNAGNGDTVTVPAGTCTWSSAIMITKSIVLRGAGIDTTTIKAGTSNTNGYLFTWSAATPATFEMSGITIHGSDVIGCLFLHNGSGGATPTTGLKVHDNKFTHCRNRAVTDNGLVYGVIYNNQFLDNFVDIGSIGAEGNGWTAPFLYGDANTVFAEDNTFTHASDATRGQVFYNAQGGRMVLRYNKFNGYIDYDVADSHGNIGTWPANRGTVGAEIYRNTFAMQPGTYSSWRFYFDRGGQSIVFNNTFTAPGGWASIEMSEEDGWQTSFGCPCPIHDIVTNTFYWNNLFNNTQIGPGYNHLPQDSTNITQGGNFFIPAKGADSSKGASCTPNTFYGATDTDKLYRCSLGGTWSLYYQPYTYPHPLRGGSSNATPSAPTNVRIVRP